MDSESDRRWEFDNPYPDCHPREAPPRFPPHLELPSILHNDERYTETSGAARREACAGPGFRRVGILVGAVWRNARPEWAVSSLWPRKVNVDISDC